MISVIFFDSSNKNMHMGWRTVFRRCMDNSTILKLLAGKNNKMQENKGIYADQSFSMTKIICDATFYRTSSAIAEFFKNSLRVLGYIRY